MRLDDTDFVGPVLGVEPGMFVKSYISKLIAYRSYAKLPVVLGWFGEFLIEVKAGDTIDTVYSDYVEKQDVKALKAYYNFQGCLLDIKRLYKEEDFILRLNDIRDGKRSYIYTARGSEYERTESFISRLARDYKIEETEWDTFVFRVDRR